MIVILVDYKQLMVEKVFPFDSLIRFKLKQLNQKLFALIADWQIVWKNQLVS
jgi:hypothetical protein